MSSSVVCVILAGGLGTRLRSVVSDRPKCLAPVNGRPFLELQLDALAELGVNRFVLSLGYMAQAVEKAVMPLRNKYALECVIESDPLGTGGAVLKAMVDLDLDEVLVTNGDTWLDAPLDAMLRQLDLSQGELMRLAAVWVPDRGRYGGLTLRGEQVVGFVSKGANGPGPINAGFYRLHRRAFAERESGDAFSLETTVLTQLVAQGALTATAVLGSFIDIGVPEDYRRFCESRG